MQGFVSMKYRIRSIATEHNPQHAEDTCITNGIYRNRNISSEVVVDTYREACTVRDEVDNDARMLSKHNPVAPGELAFFGQIQVIQKEG